MPRDYDVWFGEVGEEADLVDLPEAREDDDELDEDDLLDSIEIIGFDFRKELGKDSDWDESKVERDEKGRFGSGGGSSEGSSNAKRVEETSKKVAKELGYNPAQVVVFEDRRDFDVGGRQFTTGGLAHIKGPKRGLIEISASLNPDQVGPVMAHEVMHQKWQNTLVKLNEEKKLAKGYEVTGTNVYKADGSLKEEHEDKFPVIKAIGAITSNKESLKELADTDGVSDYSEAYWDRYYTKRNSENAFQAIHETLAEMASLEYQHPGTLKNMIARREGSPWGDLYNAAMKFGATQ